MRKQTWVLRGVLCLLIGVLLLPCQALAAGGGTLTVNYSYDGVAFSIYRVADIEADGEYQLSGAFANYSVTIPGKSLRDTAATLKGYVDRDNITAAKTERTSNGTVAFSDLAEGLYLVIGDTHTSRDSTYTPVPFLVTISGAKSGTANVKFDESTPGGGDEETSISYKAVKVWKNDEGQNRPASVTVQLLLNGTVYDTVTLNASNGWSCTWESSNATDSWQVVEKDVPAGYTVSVSQSGYVFTVTNTYQNPGNPDHPGSPDTPDKPDTPDTPNTPDTPDTPNTPDTPDTPDVPDNPDIPQTGQLWWPVIVLACCGAVLLFISRARSRKGEKPDAP